MAGLLPLATSFATRKPWTAHEFHYATTTRATGTPLFTAQDATGAALAPMGLIAGNVAGSFAHVIDAA